MKPVRPRERYEAHIFRWWMHHHFKDEEEPVVMTTFTIACERHHVTEKRGRQIVGAYMLDYKRAHNVVFDMGHKPDVDLLDMHFAFKAQQGRDFRPLVLAQMERLHNDNAFRNAVSKKLASPHDRPRRTIGDLLNERRRRQA